MRRWCRPSFSVRVSAVTAETTFLSGFRLLPHVEQLAPARPTNGVRPCGMLGITREDDNRAFKGTTAAASLRLCRFMRSTASPLATRRQTLSARNCPAPIYFRVPGGEEIIYPGLAIASSPDGTCSLPSQPKPLCRQDQ